jgi:4,5-dihydroxyphthalate decarboxylase
VSRVVIRGGAYAHTQAIAGTYHGIEIAYETRKVQDIFSAMLERREFEVCEFSLANYLVLRADGADWLTAIPVFPHRAFRHALAITRRDSPLSGLAQLAGKRVGVEDYSMTAAVWVRGLLEDEYGVNLGAITWVTYRKQRLALPPHANVEIVDEDLETLVTGGVIDAMLGFSTRDAAQPEAARRLRTVEPDPAAAEHAYYARTAIHPINHCVVIRTDVLAAQPQIAQAVASAYIDAKARAFHVNPAALALPSGVVGDPLPYGWTPLNRRVTLTLARYLERQGFIADIGDIDALFLNPAVAW